VLVAVSNWYALTVGVSPDILTGYGWAELLATFLFPAALGLAAAEIPLRRAGKSLGAVSSTATPPRCLRCGSGGCSAARCSPGVGYSATTRWAWSERSASGWSPPCGVWYSAGSWASPKGWCWACPSPPFLARSEVLPVAVRAPDDTNRLLWDGRRRRDALLVTYAIICGVGGSFLDRSAGYSASVGATHVLPGGSAREALGRSPPTRRRYPQCYRTDTKTERVGGCARPRRAGSGAGRRLTRGRVTYHSFVGSWTFRTADDFAFADHMNGGMSKYVVSKTLDKAERNRQQKTRYRGPEHAFHTDVPP
jgi:hypothetical protein